MQVYDNDGQKVLASQADASFKRYIGNGAPTSFLSWNNSFRYKNWDFGFQFRGAFGFEIFNMRRYGMGNQLCGTDNVLRNAYLKHKDRKSTRLNSSHANISYAVFCLKKKNRS